MKKNWVLASIVIALFSCNSNGDKKTNSTDEKQTDLSQNPDYQKGLALEVKQNCKTCHTIDARVTGPSFREIANKYADAPDTIVSHLANKIIAGGSGVWGEIPMLPHPEISKPDAEAIVKYILLLKK
jgi:cytochrome c